MKNRRNILKVLSRVTNDNITVKDFAIQIAKELKEEEKTQLIVDEAVIDKYKGQYVSIVKNNPVLGKEIIVMFIDNIVSDSISNEYKLTIFCEYSFSVCMFKKIKYLEDSLYLIYDLNDLKEFEIITKELYDNYVEKYEKHTELVKSIPILEDSLKQTHIRKSL